MIFNEAKILNLPVVTNNFGSEHEFIVEGQDGQICSLTVMADVIIISFVHKEDLIRIFLQNNLKWPASVSDMALFHAFLQVYTI